jgi:hypothetical protein
MRSPDRQIITRIQINNKRSTMPAGSVSVHSIDLSETRRYFKGLASLAIEAAETRDPRVAKTALAVIALQSRQAGTMGARLQ